MNFSRTRNRAPRLALLLCSIVAAAPATSAIASAQTAPPAPQSGPLAANPDAAELRHGRELLQTKQFADAETLFSAMVRAHRGGVQAQLGLGDAQLGLHRYEAAEASYRAVVAQQPELWQAHKNLVVVEAALGRWEDFDGERRILQLARQRGAPGISAHESDVIDSFDAGGAHWVVRAYFQPMGRSQAVYNFEQFSPDGRAAAYISLENAAAAQAALHPEDVRVGPAAAASPGQPTVYALNWYTGKAHGTIQHYPQGEPTYERIRADVLRWLRAHPETLMNSQRRNGTASAVP